MSDKNKNDIRTVEMEAKESELVQSDPRQGKNIQDAQGDDTTQKNAPAPTQEGEIEPATVASDPAIAEQPDLPAEADAAQAAEPEQPPVQADENVPVETRDSKTPEDFALDLLLDIPLGIKVELGRARIKVQKLLSLAPGSAIKLVRLAGEPVDILVNDTLIARGEVIVQNEKYGIRVTEITNRMDRIRSFSI